MLKLVQSSTTGMFCLEAVTPTPHTGQRGGGFQLTSVAGLIAMRMILAHLDRPSGRLPEA